VIRRLRGGELLVLAGAACLIVSMFVPWYSSPIGNLDLWDTFGPAAALMLAALCAGLAVVVSALSERDDPSLAVATAIWCVLIGLVGAISALVRLLERPQGAGSTCIGPWLGLAGTLAILLGAWLVVRDERPSLYSPAQPEPRPRP
jgi:hypothetical protein